MGFATWLGNRLRAILIIAALGGVVLIDSVSRIISLCADGFLALIVVALVWPMLKSQKSAERTPKE